MGFYKVCRIFVSEMLQGDYLNKRPNLNSLFQLHFIAKQIDKMYFIVLHCIESILKVSTFEYVSANPMLWLKGFHGDCSLATKVR